MGGWAAYKQAGAHDSPLDWFAVLSQDSWSEGPGFTALSYQGPAPYRLPGRQCGLGKRDALQGEKTGSETPSLSFVAGCSDDFTEPAPVSLSGKQS